MPMNSILEILREQKQMQLKGNLYHATQIHFAYNTNHIEGSQLTEEQTRYIYETNTFVAEEGNHTANVDDIIETSNHFKLVDYMLDVADEILTEDRIKEFHKILKTGTSDERKSWFKVGTYKELANEIGASQTSSPEEAEKEMQKLLDWYQHLEKVSFEDIVKFHSDFEKIHPFQDGNGRTGRLILFRECLKNGLIPVVIQDINRNKYLDALKQYRDERGLEKLVELFREEQNFYLTKCKYFM